MAKVGKWEQWFVQTARDWYQRNDQRTKKTGLLEDKLKTIKSVAGYAGLMSVSEKKLNKATAATLGKSPKELSTLSLFLTDDSDYIT